MRGRLVIVVLTLGLVMPSIGSAAVLFSNPVTDRLVEGHTVFAVLETNLVSVTSEIHFSPAIALLVREHETKRSASRFPGVLWFNDQYLIAPEEKDSTRQSTRYPCTGAVLMTNAGDPPPPRNDPTAYNPLTYSGESYLITDPNDHAWSIDRWVINGSFVWTVPILGNDAGYSTPWDGASSCNPYADESCVDRPEVGASCVNRPAGPYRFAKDPGDNGYGYPCGGQGSGTCSGIQYNALLFFRLEDLHVAGAPKNHTEGSTDWNDDVSGCHAAQGNRWPCPEGDDGREGNSHPYNPETPYPLHTYDGRDNEGGSADCTGDGVEDLECHATRFMDAYFGVASLPVARTYAIRDLEGSTAPYHCHPSVGPCSAEDLAS